MTEMFAAVRDALAHAPVLAVATAAIREFPKPERPWYLPEVPPQTPAQYRAALAKIARLAPNNVRVN